MKKIALNLIKKVAKSTKTQRNAGVGVHFWKIVCNLELLKSKLLNLYKNLKKFAAVT